MKRIDEDTFLRHIEDNLRMDANELRHVRRKLAKARAESNEKEIRRWERKVAEIIDSFSEAGDALNDIKNAYHKGGITFGGGV